MKLFTQAAIAATLAALTIAPAAAANEQVLVAVNYSDLDVNSAAGAAKLAQRVETEVEQACERPYIRDLKAMRDYQACVASAGAVTAELLSRSVTAAG